MDALVSRSRTETPKLAAPTPVPAPPVPMPRFGPCRICRFITDRNVNASSTGRPADSGREIPGAGFAVPYLSPESKAREGQGPTKGIIIDRVRQKQVQTGCWSFMSWGVPGAAVASLPWCASPVLSSGASAARPMLLPAAARLLLEATSSLGSCFLNMLQGSK